MNNNSKKKNTNFEIWNFETTTLNYNNSSSIIILQWKKVYNKYLSQFIIIIILSRGEHQSNYNKLQMHAPSKVSKYQESSKHIQGPAEVWQNILSPETLKQCITQLAHLIESNNLS